MALANLASTSPCSRHISLLQVHCQFKDPGALNFILTNDKWPQLLLCLGASVPLGTEESLCHIDNRVMVRTATLLCRVSRRTAALCAGQLEKAEQRLRQAGPLLLGSEDKTLSPPAKGQRPIWLQICAFLMWNMLVATVSCCLNWRCQSWSNCESL